MQLQTLTDPTECFITLANEWHELLQRSVINHVFITPEFQQAWWQTLGQEDGYQLQLLTIRDDQHKLVGIAPLFRLTNEQWENQLSFIGCVNVSDYLDFVIDRDYINEVYQEICRFFQDQADMQTGFLCSLTQNSPTLTTFKTQLETAGWQIEQTQQDVCPVIALPSTWDEYLAVIGKKQRHEIKRKWEKLFQETNAEFELVELPSDTDSAIADFIQLHQASSQDKKNFWDDRHVAFFQYFAQSTAKQSWLKLYFLKIDGLRVAAMLGFAYNHQFFLYNSGFAAENYRQYGVGAVLTSYTIQQAIERGEHRYDFLRGDEEYKFRFRAIPEPIFDLKLTPPKS